MFKIPELPPLPVLAAAPDLCRALAERRGAVLTAPPGSGKTTLVPLILAAQPWLADQAVVVLEPRRLAARAAAARMAELLGEEVGERVGYRVRFDSAVGPRTRVEVVTEGILTRRLQDDPGLEGVGMVVFDEFHERSLEADLALALLLQAREVLRPDLAILVMSATLECGPVAALLGGVPVVSAGGRTYPVTVIHQPETAGAGDAWTDSRPAVLARGCKGLVRRALAEQEGDVLVFLPGMAAINATAEALADLESSSTVVRILAGHLPLEEQRRVLRPEAGANRRRVVLATDIAETSLTIEGVGAVVDAGWARRPRFDPATGLTRLVTVRISRMNAAQRTGRAGRLGPGRCYRLWPRSWEVMLPAAPVPEIRQADLSRLVLELARWGSQAADLAWLDPPPAASLAQGRELLVRLGVLDEDGGLTALGRRVAAIPLHPRLAAILAWGREHHAGHRAAELAALLAERDLFGYDHTADMDLRLARLARPHGDRRLARVARLARELRRWSGDGRGVDSGTLLAQGYPDRIGRRRTDTRRPGLYRLSLGSTAMLDPADPLASAEYLVAAEVAGGGPHPRIRRAAAVDGAVVQNLPAVRREVTTVVAEGRVVSREQLRLDGLVLAEHPGPEPAADDVVDLLLAEVARRGLDCLGWSRRARSLQARLAFLHRVLPDDGWPRVDDAFLLATLEEWLPPWLGGCRSLADVAAVDMATVLAGRLDHHQMRRLDELAPERLTVASGSRLALEYPAGGPPVLRVRLQEMFGEVRTPRVAGGRVPVLLHLLSPAGRPVQVTDDLASFWREGYYQVKKELAGRYPRHHWPDDPLTAPATRRCRPRRAKGGR